MGFIPETEKYEIKFPRVVQTKRNLQLKAEDEYRAWIEHQRASVRNEFIETDNEAFATYYHGKTPVLQVKMDKRTGAASTKEFAPNEEPAEGTVPSLFLYVSNQSFDVTPVDIKVTIDDKVVADQSFEVGNQHTWKEFPLVLSKGRHKLHVESMKGQSVLDKELDIKNRHWAALDFWYSEKERGGAPPAPKHFVFDLKDEPIMFQ